MIIRRFALVSSLVVLSSLGFSTVARAGEGGVAGSAAFTVSGGEVTGVAVSAAVGKESAIAHAFNYNTDAGGLQNSAFAIGTAGIVGLSSLGNPNGFSLSTAQDTDRATPQNNTFTTGYSIQLGTTAGNVVNQVPTPAP